VFLFLFAPNLLREGMFVDGLWYASIGNNLANDIGSFWKPMFTATIFKDFYEQPPLSLGIQSLFFKVFGDSFWTERLYCFVIFLCTIFLIIKIWFLLFNNHKEYKKLFYFPLLIWMVNFEVFFAYPNNLIECTLTVFLLIAIYYLLKSIVFNNWKSHTYIFVSSLFIFAGFLTKGLVSLFPLCFFILYGMIYRNNLLKNISKTFILIASFLCCLFVLFLFDTPSSFLINYLETQVLEALNGNRIENMRDSRFYIIKSLFKGIPISLGIPVILVVITYFSKKQKTVLATSSKNMIVFFLLLGISASAPIMVSLKQAGYYLIPSIPFFSIAIAIWATPSLLYVREKVKTNKKAYSIYSFCILFLFMLSLFLALKNIGTIDKRDFESITDMKEISKYVPNNSTLSLKSDCFEHSLHGIFQRYHFISLDTTLTNRKYLLIKKNIDTIPIKNYTKSGIITRRFNLYLKTNPLLK